MRDIVIPFVLAAQNFSFFQCFRYWLSVGSYSDLIKCKYKKGKLSNCYQQFINSYRLLPILVHTFCGLQNCVLMLIAPYPVVKYWSGFRHFVDDKKLFLREASSSFHLVASMHADQIAILRRMGYVGDFLSNNLSHKCSLRGKNC